MIKARPTARARPTAAIEGSGERPLPVAVGAPLLMRVLLVNCDPEAVTALIRDHLERAAEGGEHTDDPLSPRESEVIKLIAEGHTSKEIAELLVISEKTVERHRSNILDKLGLRDRVDMTRYAIRRGLVEP